MLLRVAAPAASRVEHGSDADDLKERGDCRLMVAVACRGFTLCGRAPQAALDRGQAPREAPPRWEVRIEDGVKLTHWERAA
jgi:hypothetical protein